MSTWEGGSDDTVRFKAKTDSCPLSRPENVTGNGCKHRAESAGLKDWRDAAVAVVAITIVRRKCGQVQVAAAECEAQTQSSGAAMLRLFSGS